MNRTLQLVTLAALATVSTLSAQDRPLPEAPELQAPYLAWDRGDYPTAVRGYLELLRGPNGAAHLEEIALLTGELFSVTELTTDGGDVVTSPDGAFGAYRLGGDPGGRTRIIDLRTGTTVRDVTGPVLALGYRGSFAYLDARETPAVIEARAALATASSSFARRRAAALLRWEEAKAAELVVVAEGSRRVVETGGLVPLGVTFTSGEGLIALAAPASDPGAAAPYRLALAGPEAIAHGEGPTTGLLVSSDGETVVAVKQGGLFVWSAGRSSELPGAIQPSLSVNGAALAFLRSDGTSTTLEAIDLAGSAWRPRVLVETDKRVANPSVSPDGGWVAYQLMDLHDWEVFAAATDGSGERRLTLEIQHDEDPLWIDDNRVVAVKGEGRHQRSYLYDVRGGEPIKLFHNNTIRTIAPEYAWATTPGSNKLMIVAERDGDTVSPERGVYLLDLDSRVTRDQLVARLETALEAELDLRERGQAMFAPIADQVAPVTEAVSAARIQDYARSVHAFGSKHVTQPGNAPAIEYYASKLRSFGYEPELQWFETRDGIRTANVIVRVPGTVNPEIVYAAGSHFDSSSRGPGADDNSSGSTALLEAARVLMDHPMPATIELVFFTGEEAGLLGSREYVRQSIASGKQLVGALNNDMVGWKNDNRLDNTIRYSNPGIRDIQHAAAMLFSKLITYDALYYKSTDAAAFYEAYGDIVGGIGSYPVLGNPHYHQWTDRVETIDHELVAQVSKTTVATLMLLASSPSRIEGLVVEGRSARWEPSPEFGIVTYEVRWETENGWLTIQVREPLATLDALRPGGRVQVRALAANGTAGWDWARATAG